MNMANSISHNGHETNGELARRNLLIAVERLREMRWMVEKAGGDLVAFDHGVQQLDKVFQDITASPVGAGNRK